ncbi:hypothetical protein [Fimbriiglobus ruber]|uniref:Glycoside hydrolase family 38 N-terminal domain-containing protein n=1 Tax=Fimbriiglobus ruber TaxID=1908690 RepID=A0A225DZN4_9BACT|nr:hypothetical protein [Fimbriiglobus ruber]OWK45034.1 hypothetical protein FRUB_01365 [Fimbriiglobus ruber]
MTEAHLLSPYRPPTSYPVSLSADETAAWLNGYFALWHPAVLARIGRVPAAASSYDHDSPGEGNVYVVPEGPHLYQPDDWATRVTDARAVAFRATADSAATRDNLLRALRDAGETSPLLDAPADAIRTFAGLGYGYLIVDGLFDAADHEKLLDADGFWADITAAVGALSAPDAASTVTAHLRTAAEKLRSAREALNSNTIHLLDWAIPDPANLGAAWPAALGRGLPLTVLASGELLERLAAEFPARFAELKAKFLPDLPGAIDLACGAYAEREDALLPPESQWWNLAKARATVRTLFGVETEVFARKRSANHPQIPAWVQHFGYKKAVLVSFDGALAPARTGAVVTWPGPDGKTIDAFAREPQSASDPLTFFNVVYTLHQAMTQDSIPTLALAHKGAAPAVGYEELVALAELASAVGEFSGLGRYLAEHHYGEYLGTSTADDFFADYLDERVTTLHRPDPVSGFPAHLRLRRRLDSAFALAALHRSLTPPTADEDVSLQKLTALEDAIEHAGASAALPESGTDFEGSLVALESEWAKKLADRIQARATAGQPGLMVLNPCGFTRRVALELDNFGGPIPVTDPVKAAQFDGATAKLVVEVPALGFAWVPRTAPAGTQPPKPRMKTADGTSVRNEFFEAELDPATGGLRAFRDARTRLNRLGMQLVFNPGSKTKARSIKVTQSGTALGEIVAEGEILDEHDAVLATFRHRVRAWVGRPALEVLIEIDPGHAPSGYAWHAYYGARFGWRDERAALFRGVNGANVHTSYTRPVSADYLETRLGSERTFVFTGGLPFIQRHGTRMADVILIPEGERGRRFEFLIAADRDYPMQTAAGWVAPAPVVVTDRSPPPVGPSSWLAHVDLPSLLMTSLRPCPPGEGMGRAVAARFIECAGFGGAADLQFARTPDKAAAVDGEGHQTQEIILAGHAIPLEFSAGEAFRVRAEWA